MSKDRVKELQKEIDKIVKKREKAMKTFDFNKKSLVEWQQMLEPFNDQMRPLQFEKAQLTPIEWQNIGKYGDLMTLEDWIGCVKAGWFIDYDGHGYYSDGERESNKIVYPSDVKHNHLLKNENFTHVIWYNR